MSDLRWLPSFILTVKVMGKKQLDPQEVLLPSTEFRKQLGLPGPKWLLWE